MRDMTSFMVINIFLILNFIFYSLRLSLDISVTHNYLDYNCISGNYDKSSAVAELAAMLHKSYRA